VLVEKLETRSLPDALEDSRRDYVELAAAYKQINAAKGSVGRNSLVYANRAITGTDKGYTKYLAKIGEITEQRNELAAEMIALLNAAAFKNKSIRDHQGDDLIDRAMRLVDKVEDLADHAE
jgi:flagellar biosynthesis/type III secretory pathway protein FliH